MNRAAFLAQKLVLIEETREAIWRETYAPTALKEHPKPLHGAHLTIEEAIELAILGDHERSEWLRSCASILLTRADDEMRSADAEMRLWMFARRASFTALLDYLAMGNLGNQFATAATLRWENLYRNPITGPTTHGDVTLAECLLDAILIGEAARAVELVSTFSGEGAEDRGLPARIVQSLSGLVQDGLATANSSAREPVLAVFSQITNWEESWYVPGITWTLRLKVSMLVAKLGLGSVACSDVLTLMRGVES